MLRSSLFSSLVCEVLTLLCVVFLQRSSARAASVIILGGGGWESCAGLHELHVIGREHTKVAARSKASPPALVDHLDPGDDVVGIE